MPEPRIILLTGERRIGKTTVCARLIEGLRRHDIATSGLLTRRVGPHALQVTELLSGDTYALTLPYTSEAGIDVGQFRMDPDAVARSAKALGTCFPTQVFILDEIGPLELLHGQGWVGALKLLKRSSYRVAYIVIRPELLVRAVWQLPALHYTVVHVTAETRDAVPASLLAIATEACTDPEYEFATG